MGLYNRVQLSRLPSHQACHVLRESEGCAVTGCFGGPRRRPAIENPECSYGSTAKGASSGACDGGGGSSLARRAGHLARAAPAPRLVRVGRQTGNGCPRNGMTTGNNSTSSKKLSEIKVAENEVRLMR
ncbi:unnamed protein product [Boreogadus saida]